MASQSAGQFDFPLGLGACIGSALGFLAIACLKVAGDRVIAANAGADSSDLHFELIPYANGTAVVALWAVVMAVVAGWSKKRGGASRKGAVFGQVLAIVLLMASVWLWLVLQG